jgi:hydrogenase maturation protease
VTPVRVIGIGSPHGVDRVGWAAVDALQCAGLAQRFPPGQVSLARCAVPADLYRLLEGCRYAVVIDAVPGPSGRLAWFDAGQVRGGAAPRSVHGVDAGEMLALLATLAESPPRVAVLGVGVDVRACAATPGDGVVALPMELEARVSAAIRGFLATGGGPQTDCETMC